MLQSTPPSLSQTISPRWESRQFLTLLTVQTLLPVTFGNSLSSEVVVMRQLRRWKALTKVIDTLTQEDFHGVFQMLLERYNKCIAAGGDYFEGDKSFMCVLSIKVPIRKKSLETYLMIIVCICRRTITFMHHISLHVGRPFIQRYIIKLKKNKNYYVKCMKSFPSKLNIVILT